MTVYVDDARHPYGRMIMCHMTADSPMEMHAMAKKCGVARKWAQSKGRHLHYDICLAKRALAIKNGAQVVTQRQMAKLAAKAQGVW